MGPLPDLRDKHLRLGEEPQHEDPVGAAAAAKALQREELGTLKVGAVGDATILSVREGKFDYVDVKGEHLIGDKRIVSDGVVVDGKWWHPQTADAFRAKEHA